MTLHILIEYITSHRIQKIEKSIFHGFYIQTLYIGDLRTLLFQDFSFIKSHYDIFPTILHFDRTGTIVK